MYKFIVSIVLLCIGYTLLAQECYQPCHKLTDQIRGKNYGKHTYAEMVAISDSIVSLTAECPSCIYFSHTFWEWAAHQFRYAKNYKDQYWSLVQLDSVYRSIEWDDAIDTLNEYCNLMIRYGHYYNDIQDHRNAIKHYQFIIDTINTQKAYIPQLQQLKNISYQRLSDIANSEGNVNQAIDYLTYTINDEIEHAKQRNKDPVVWSIYSKRGHLKYLDGRYKDAFDDHMITFRHIEGYLDTVSLSRLRSRSLSQIFVRLINFGKTCIQLKNEEYYEKCLNYLYALPVEKKHKLKLSLSLLEYEHALSMLNDSTVPAITDLEELLTTLDTIPEEIDLKLETYTVLADAYNRTGAYDKGKRLIQEALSYVENIDSGTTYSRRYTALNILGIENELQQGDESQALLQIEKLLSFANQRLAQDIYESDHFATLDDISKVLEKGLEICYVSERYDLAFRIIEYVKARQLEKIIRSQKFISSQKNKAASDLNRINSSLQSLKVDIALGDTTLRSKNKRFELEQERQNILSKITNKNAPSLERVELTTLQDHLPSDIMYTTSFAGKSNHYFLHITDQETIFIKEDQRQIKLLINDFLTELENPTSLNQCYRLGERLYSRIFQNVKFPARLTCAMDGLLQTIPLEALRYEDKFLTEATSVHYVPSAVFYLQSGGSKVSKSLVVKPSQEVNEVVLNASQQETDYLAQQLNADTLYKDDATISRFIALSKDYDIIHLATHADSDRSNHKRAFIQLSNGKDDDGKLYFDNLASLNLDAELVSLSACKTGVGRIINYEGTQSLGTQVLANGANAVVSTLWSINDQTTSSILQKFYAHLYDKNTKDQALTSAKREYLSSAIDFERHPHYWAGIVLTGSNHPLSFDSKWTYYVFAAVLLVLVFFLFRKRMFGD